MDKVLVITGPTASGKSGLSIQLAQKYNGEVISGDSVQVYRHLDIGSAKITEAEKQGIPHHLINIIEPSQEYSVYDFQKSARTIITDTIKNGKLPIIVGGTGLYIKALLFDYDFLPENQTTQDFSAYSNQELYDLVTEKDSAAVDKLHVNNRKRLIRTLQLLDKLPMNKTEFLAQQKKDMLYDALIIGLTLNRTVLHKIINERVEEMFNIGLCEEVRALLDSGIKFENQCMSAIGYKEFQPYFNKSCELKEVKEKIKAHTRQFAKRQYTWLNHQLPVSWVDVTEDNYLNKTTQMIENWLD